MGAGRAYGINRDYQLLCRDVLCRMREEDRIRPYQGDGIDVPLLLSGVVRTFDVALADKHDRIVVAECKRTSDPVQLVDLDAFAYRVELVRRETGKEVAGVYFAKTGYQIGAIKAGEYAGVQVVVCAHSVFHSS